MLKTLSYNIIPDLYENFINIKIINIFIILYVSPEGYIDCDDAELEIFCENNRLLRLSTASDGERVALHRKPWIDPFMPPISKENQDYIQEYGKWVLFDIDDFPEFSVMIGEKISGIDTIINKFGVLSGLAIACGEKTICFCTYCDEGRIFWGKNNSDMATLGFRIE